MKCPTDNATLVMSERSGIEIDYCPECRGVWLDRGELDKIIDRAAADSAPAAAPQAPRYSDSHHDKHSYGGQKPYRKKNNWLGEIFD